MDIDRALDAARRGLAERDAEGRIRAEYLLDDAFPGFSGHFPGHPICPAILEVRAAVRAVGNALNRDLELTAVDAAKFLKPVGPGERLSILCEPRGADRFDARVESAGAQVARFTFSTRDKAP